MFHRRIVAALFFALLSVPALAHTGAGSTSAFASGFVHPLGGLDHVLAMIAVGVLAGLLGGRSLWAIPICFMTMMLVGGILGFVGIELPGVELTIAMSVIALGALVMLGGSLFGGAAWQRHAATGLVGVFAIFHGYAHGAELPVGAGAAAYSFGFVVATGLLHGTGIVGALSMGSRRHMSRLVGAIIAVAGVAIAVI
jgi:urease accessory protein